MLHVAANAIFLKGVSNDQVGTNCRVHELDK